MIVMMCQIGFTVKHGRRCFVELAMDITYIIITFHYFGEAPSDGSTRRMSNDDVGGGRKPLRQAVHEGFISLSLSDKSIILCFYAFDRLRKYVGSFRFLRRF
jgi:hypothetical protein